MKIVHVAIWARDIETLKKFYLHYFNCTSSEIYVNHQKNFKSYFLGFNNGVKIELMTKPELKSITNGDTVAGLAHFAICVGSRHDVDALTHKISGDGYSVSGWPRVTGDGYYESVVIDPEGNLIELVAETDTYQ
ncbi:MAG: VOC family protein [Bacteroidales bacterium]